MQIIKKLISPLFVLILSIIFLVTCGDDGGGGGGNSGSSKVPQIQTLATRSLGQISAGSTHACALTAEGKVLCWGEGVNGRLGNNADANLNHPDPSKPVVDENGDALTGIVQVSAGGKHSCALTEEGGVLCWGKAANGVLGNDCDSSCTDKNHAVAVVAEDGGADPLTGIVQISAGRLHTCALTDGGEVLCWGEGSFGRLGNHSVASKDHPVSTLNLDDSSTPLSGIAQISAGIYHTCALTVDGNLKCWGSGGNGRLGIGSSPQYRSRADIVVDGDNSSTPLSGIVQVSAGGTYTCALTKEGKVKCWGNGSNGRLGNDGDTDKEHPVDVVDGNGSSTPLANVSQINSGGSHTCALASTGGVKCWGVGDNGRLGNDATADKNYPVDVVAESGSPFALSSIVQMDVGSAYACAVIYSGEVRCWGHGGDGELGNNVTADQPAPVAVVSDSSGTHFHAGLWRREYHCYDDDTCEIDPDSLIRPVLTGARSGASQTPEVEVLGLEEGETVTLHTDAKCLTGSIGTGTVATGETSIAITPINSPTTRLLLKYNRIYAKVGEACSSSGADYTLTIGLDLITGDALSTDRTPTLTVARTLNDDELSLHSNSDCSDDALASGTATTTTHELTLSSLTPGSHTFYLKQNEICHPRGFDYTLAKSIQKPSRVSGGDAHTCALTSTSGVKCWGNNDSKELGNKGTADTDAPVDVKLSDGTALADIVQVDTGGYHACAVTSGGGVKCWGLGSNGRLGNDSIADKDHAVNVVAVGGSGTLSGIVQVSGGEHHTCAVTDAGGVVCWGKGGNGQLGNDASADSDHPVAVVDGDDSSTALAGIVQVSAGDSFTCALTSSGGVKCWGDSSTGSLGIGFTTGNRDAPVKVQIGGIIQISAGDNHTCALTSGNKVKCWGARNNGRLGNGATTGIAYTPVNVRTSSGDSTNLSGIVQVSAGEQHTCAVTDAGGVICWGQQSSAGKLGTDCDSTCPDQSAPVVVKDSDGGSGTLTGITGIDLGNSHTCAVTSSGGVKCWGEGGSGRLGNDGTANKPTPRMTW